MYNDFIAVNIACVIYMCQYAHIIENANAKNTHQIKKVSNKSCSELDFVQKSPRGHMSIFPQSGARRLERLIWLKYYFVLKRGNTFN